MTRSLLAVLSCVSFTASLSAQVPWCERQLWSLDVSQLLSCSGGSCEFGTRMDVGDFDGDGAPDIVTGAHGTLTQPRVQVRSGADGSVLREVLGTNGTRFGFRVAALGDLDGDLLDDFAVSAPWQNAVLGAVTIHSGADGTLLNTLQTTSPGNYYFGYQMACAGDVDNDGLRDVIASTDVGGLVVVASAMTGAVIHQVTGPWTTSVSSAGDMDNDGHDDFAIAPSSSGFVTIYSGASGDVMFAIAPPDPGNTSRMAMRPAGDVNGDGHVDLVVGNPQVNGGPGNSSGAVYVISGSDGSVLHRNLGYAFNTSLGWSVAAGGDVNRDGHPDYAAGGVGDATFGQSSGRVDVFSGADGSLLFSTFGNQGDWQGYQTLFADLNQNGVAEVLVTSRGESVGPPFPVSGTVRIVEVDVDPWFESPVQTSYTAVVGVPFSLPITARDVSCSSGETTLDVTGMPLAASNNPALPLAATGASPTATTQFSWTPTASDIGTHQLTYFVSDENGVFEAVDITIEVAECFLLLGGAPASAPLGGGDKLLVDYVWIGAISATSMPTFVVPNLLGLSVYSQVVMFNPYVYPNDPLQLSHGLEIVIGGGGIHYGDGGSGITFALTQPPLPGAQLSFGVVIP